MEPKELRVDPDAYITMAAQSDEPEVTISFDCLANGQWRYKTSITMALDLEAVPAALAAVDALARAERDRRMALDATEKSSGTVSFDEAVRMSKASF